MKTALLILLSAFLVIIISCNGDTESNTVILNEDYCAKTELDCQDNYPLVVGYLKKDDAGSYEITGTTMIDGKNYFVWTLINQGNVYENYDRMENNKLYSRYSSGGSISDEFMTIDFNAEVNTEWEVANYYDLGAAILKMESKNTDLIIKGTTFTNAIKVSVSFPNAPSNNYNEYYLPGLGFVKGYFYTYEFHIDGKKYIIK